jgi:spore maturation protein CgeB
MSVVTSHLSIPDPRASRQAAEACPGSAREAASRALRSDGRPAASVRAAIVVSSRADLWVPCLRELLPRLQTVVVLEPAPQPSRTSSPSPPSTHRSLVRGVEVVRACVDAGGDGYSTDAYTVLAETLVTAGLGPSECLPCMDEQADGTDRVACEALWAAVEDLFWRQSRGLLRRMGPVSEGATAAFARWAQHLGESGEPYQAMKFFHRLLGRVPVEELAQPVMRCLVDLGCAGPLALWWVERLAWAEADRAALRSEIETAIAQNAEIEERTLAANLEALARRGLDLASELRGRGVPGAHAVVLPDVPWRVALSDGTLRRDPYPLVFGYDGERLAELNVPRDPRRILGPSLLESYIAAQPSTLVGTLASFDTLVNLADNPARYMPGAEQAIYVVEEDLDVAATVLRTVDLGSVLGDDRVRCFVGPGAVDRLRAELEGNDWLPAPAIRVGAGNGLLRALASAESSRNARFEQHAARYDQLFPRSFPREVLERLDGVVGPRTGSGGGSAVTAGGSAGGEPLRLMLATSLFTTVLQYVVRDLDEALRASGVSTRVCMERTNVERMSGTALAREIVGFQPHALLVIDHLRPEWGAAIPRNLPWICWIQDKLAQLLRPATLSKLGPLDLAFAAYSPWVEELRAAGMPHVGHLRCAFDARRYGPVEPAPEPANEVAYIVHLGSAGPFFPKQAGFDEAIVALLEERGVGYLVPELYERLARDAASAAGLRLPAEELACVAAEIPAGIERSWDRRRVLRWLVEAGIPVALYGKGWDRDPEFARLSRGPLEPGAALAHAYRSHKVVLQVNQCLNTHPRVFEALGAGGFVLARRAPSDTAPGELGSCLEDGREIAMFSTREQLVAQVRKAFSDEPWRRAIASAGQRRVRAEQTYQVRARELLAAVRSALERAVAAGEAS